MYCVYGIRNVFTFRARMCKKENFLYNDLQ